MFAEHIDLIQYVWLAMNGHPLIADDSISERLVLSTPYFALQNRPLKGGRIGCGLRCLSKRSERLQIF